MLSRTHGKTILTLAAVFLALTSCDSPTNKATRASVRIRELTLGGHTFLVPNNYLDHNEPSLLVMRLLLPDLSPRTRDNEALLNSPKSKGTIQIVVSDIEHKPNAASDRFRDPAATEKHLSHLVTAGHYSPPEQIEEDLVAYKAADRRDDLYVFNDADGIRFVLECPQPSTYPNPQCESASKIFGNLYLKYWYPLEHQERAKDIDMQIEALLNTFRKGIR